MSEKLQNQQNQPILVVEDEASIASFVAMYLKKAGFDVATAPSGSDALTRVADDSPALIVLDLVLGEIDGWVVLTQLRADELARDIPVILCTAAT